jgi:universal stress protein F
MYQKIMIPIDMQHVDKMDKALQTAADLASHYGATLCYVAVSGKVPNRVAPTPEEFARKLEEYAAEQGGKHGIDIQAKAISSVDVTIELDDKLIGAAKDIGADLIVMASHIPGVPDRLHLISSNAAYIVRHSDISVFVVR